MVSALILSLAWVSLTLDAPAPGQPAAAAASPTSEFRGRVVCLDPAGRRQACGPAAGRFALETGDGKLHPFLESDPLAAIFEDPRVRGQEVVVKARPHPDGAVEIVKVYSVKQGKLHDVHYYCEICNITAYAPGLCPCCRREMELKETPVP
jgi:hypothetical protein